MASHRVRGDKIRKTVILDSSALLMFFEFSVDWEKELARLLDSYQIVVPVVVVKELKLLSSEGTGEKQRCAKAALNYIARYETIETQAKNADEGVIEAATTTKGVVFTNDAALRKHLRSEGVPVLFLRGRKKIALDE
jgi:rRNA-processing protein FCF1